MCKNVEEKISAGFWGTFFANFTDGNAFENILILEMEIIF
jgi:hypothetical protein